MIILCDRDGKKASRGRPLSSNLPVPSRSRTRATASLRRPVPAGVRVVASATYVSFSVFFLLLDRRLGRAFSCPASGFAVPRLEELAALLEPAPALAAVWGFLREGFAEETPRVSAGALVAALRARDLAAGLA